SLPNSEARPQVASYWVGTDFEFEILRANPWSAHLVVAQSFRSGYRVVLAGDAAHQVIPTGGYGMNSGVGDAIGLAWVLAANVQGWGGIDLVDAYDIERRNAAWWFNQASREHMSVRIKIAELYANAGDIQSDTPEANASRRALASSIEAIGNAENESWGVEFGYRYDRSPIVAHEAEAPPADTLSYAPSTVPGARLPHVFLHPSGEAIHDLLGEFFTLIVLSNIDVSSFEAAASGIDMPLKVLRLDEAAVAHIYERYLILVRPDQHVAWRGNTIPTDVPKLLGKVTGNSVKGRSKIRFGEAKTA
ncbi:MAG: FAD-dependent monooxygenase, partial [Pseudomonadota bacterium]